MTDSKTEKAQSTPRRQVFMMMADPILEKLYHSALESSDYCAVWCTREERWNHALLSFPYDVIVIDLSLFPSNPIENLLEIKRLTPESDLIVLSESDDVRIAIAAFQSGIQNYFLKPTNPETLTWAISRILRRRELTSSNKALAADLRVFSVAHHVSVAENDEKMREITLKHLVQLMNAGGGLWVWPAAEPAAEKRASAGPFRIEVPQGNEDSAKQALLDFVSANAVIMRQAFENDLTSRPEAWIQGSFAWIPLRASWMGGVLLYDVKADAEVTLPARLEFLVRNLEVSLDNYHRFKEARQLTYIDDLTGLYNSRYLEIAIGAAIEGYHSSHTGFSVLFVDIDKFKSVNDQHGHLVGSQLLVDVAQHLKKSLRKKDQLFRYGGDEFICLIEEVKLEKAMEAAERIRADMEKHRFLIQSKDLRITLSIGVACFPEHGRDRQRILQMADEAMYAGKKNGRNAVFTASVLPTPAAKAS